MTTDEEALIGSTGVQPALKVDSADDVAWDDSADLVVVGFGGAGAAAALDGAERGAEVIALDRFGGGGATAFSGGIYYACGTPIQREAGIEDSPEEMRKYLEAEGAPVDPGTLARFCTESAANFDWVNRFVPYSAALYAGKATYPPEGKFLYYCGNEKTPRFAEVAKPAARGHRAVGTGYTGHVFHAGLRRGAMAAGVRLIPHAPVRRLVMDASGTVIGVEALRMPPHAVEGHEALYKQVDPHVPMKGRQAEKAIAAARAYEAEHGVPVRIRARRGVVLAAGGFVYNLDLLRRYRPDMARAYAEILRLGSMGCDGSGIALGASAGGHVDLMGNAFIGKTVSPPEAYLHGLLVNRAGRRFINEDAYIGVVGNAIADQSDEGSAYLVMDGPTFWKGLWTALTFGKGMFYFWGLPALLNIFLGGTKRGGSLKALARRIRVDPAGLERSVADYNGRIAAGVPDDLGKLPANIAPLGKGPYYALNMSIRNKFGLTPVFTLGGLRVEGESGLMKRADGGVVAGLYAAGRTAVGLCSAGYISGLSLADLVFSGRRAAAHALGAQPVKAARRKRGG